MKAPAQVDLLSIVEAAYSFDPPRDQWMADLLRVTDGAVGVGLPGFACAFQVNRDGTFAVDRRSVAVQRVQPNVVDMLFDGLEAAPPGWLSEHFRGGQRTVRAILTSEVDPEHKLRYRRGLLDQGIADGLNIACVDLDDRGVLISLALSKIAPMRAETRHNLVRVGTHVLAGLRLRNHLGVSPTDDQGTPTDPPDGPPPPGSVAAVLSPQGKVVHADGEARLAGPRRALQAAVRDVESARTSLRGDPSRALRLWRGLVSARWTLVETFESDGARYVVARENPPHVRTLMKLTPRERLVVTYAVRGFSAKETAYALGISPATVRVLIMRAARRCGARTKQALVKRGHQVDA